MNERDPAAPIQFFEQCVVTLAASNDSSRQSDHVVTGSDFQLKLTRKSVAAIRVHVVRDHHGSSHSIVRFQGSIEPFCCPMRLAHVDPNRHWLIARAVIRARSRPRRTQIAANSACAGGAPVIGLAVKMMPSFLPGHHGA
ncbi:hypothetical protein CIC12_31300 [Burkholderia sp. SG-MS1]|nr:hypothetical protein [Paraburkholderia sp. SG-MS1]